MTETEPIAVLVASNDARSLEIAQRVLAQAGDRLIAVTNVAEAIATAASERPEVAFVDLAMEDESALSLVHHLAAVCPGIAVHAIVRSSRMELAAQAISLGAAGLLVSPPNGDGLLQAVGDARARRAEAKKRKELAAELDRMRRQNELLERVVRLARGSGHSEAVRAIAEALAEASGAQGAALYATFDQGAECVRLGATGTTRDAPAICRGEDLARFAEARKAKLAPLQAQQGTLGLALLERPDETREREIDTMTDLATAVLALIDTRQGSAPVAESTDHRRPYTFGYFQDVASREIEKAKRHERRLAIAAIVLDAESGEAARREIEEVVRTVVRDTDVFAAHRDDQYFLLLPETGTIGANACRRRLLIRAAGDRRAKTAASDRRAPASGPSRGAPLSIGIASFPHDGGTLDRLVRIASQRAKDQARSAVHALGLASLPLDEIIDTLMSRPMLDAGSGSPRPLDLATPALHSLVAQACREGSRGGAATVYVTMQPGMGLVSAARQAVHDANDVSVKVVDVRGVEGCADAEAIVITAEHGTWTCCGRVGKERFHGMHSADPLLADLAAQRLAQAGGRRA
jgi:ActR/RegA family two-component response regulator